MSKQATTEAPAIEQEGNDFAKFLEVNGISQAEFARMTGIHYTAICHYAASRRKPSRHTANLIAKFTNGLVPSDYWDRMELEVRPKPKIKITRSDKKRLALPTSRTAA